LTWKNLIILKNSLVEDPAEAGVTLGKKAGIVQKLKVVVAVLINDMMNF